MKTIFEVINPSDKCTVESDNVKAACFIVMIASQGAYGLKWEEDGKEESMPPLMFGDPSPYFKEKFDIDLEAENLLEEDADFCAACAEVLESAAYIGVEERESYVLALSKITDPEKKQEFISEWDDKKRTSLNQIVKNFHRIAANLRKRETNIRAGQPALSTK